MRIVVRNLSYRAVEGDLRGLFLRHGAVARVSVSRGSAAVDMRERREALAAIRALDGRALLGRPIRLSEAEPSGAALMDLQESCADFGRS